MQWQLLQLSGSKIICECWFSRAIVTSIYQEKKAPHSLYLNCTQIQLDIKKLFYHYKIWTINQQKAPMEKTESVNHTPTLKICHLAKLANGGHQPHAVRPFQQCDQGQSILCQESSPQPGHLTLLCQLMLCSYGFNIFVPVVLRKVLSCSGLVYFCPLFTVFTHLWSFLCRYT